MNRAYKRYTFSIGNYILYRDGHLGRIDYVFVYEMTRKHERRIFLVLTKVMVLNDDVEVLKLKEVQDTNEPIIIGLPAVQTDRIYIVDISKLKDRYRPGHQPKWVRVNWDIILM